MGIQGISFNPEIASIYQAQTISQPLASVQETTKESDKDSYIPSMANTSEAIPSGIYNASGLMVGETEESNLFNNGTLDSGLTNVSAEGTEAAAANAVLDSESAMGGSSVSDEESASGSGASGVGGAGGSGGGSGSSESTETRVVTVNGQTYLETTTTDENGNTTTTRTLIGSASVDGDGNQVSSGPSPAAQALAAM